MTSRAITSWILDEGAWSDEKLKSLSTAELEELTFYLSQEEEAFKKRKERLQGLLTERFAQNLQPGTHYTDSQGRKVRIEIPKKVEWDQEGLQGLAEFIKRKRGENPKDYIDYKMFVPETRFRSWPRSIQIMFEPARTVSPGRPKITFVEPNPDK